MLKAYFKITIVNEGDVMQFDHILESSDPQQMAIYTKFILNDGWQTKETVVEDGKVVTYLYRDDRFSYIATLQKRFAAWLGKLQKQVMNFA